MDGNWVVFPHFFGNTYIYIWVWWGNQVLHYRNSLIQVNAPLISQSLFTCLPSGNQTWQWTNPNQWRVFIGNSAIHKLYKWLNFRSCLITKGKSTGKPRLVCVFPPAFLDCLGNILTVNQSNKVVNHPSRSHCFTPETHGFFHRRRNHYDWDHGLCHIL
jgi:hypothetical protein